MNPLKVGILLYIFEELLKKLQHSLSMKINILDNLNWYRIILQIHILERNHLY